VLKAQLAQLVRKASGLSEQLVRKEFKVCKANKARLETPDWLERRDRPE
jgi:hypothetical protein